MNNRIDTIAHYQTPEGVDLSFTLAGPMVRAMAWLIDFSIRAVCYFILAMFATFTGGFGAGIMFIGMFLIEWFYPVVFEVYNGMSPGKQAMGIMVVHDDGTPVSWSSSLLRNLLRCIDFLPSLNIVGLITMILNSRYKRLGDLTAGTVVIYNKRKFKQFTIPNYDAKPPPLPLKLEEQRLILDFCERAGRLSSERRRELAETLTLLSTDDKPENEILAFGNWFLKGKESHESKSV